MAIYDYTEKVLDFESGAQLNEWQIQSICDGRTDNQIKEYMLKEGWEQEEVDEFIEWL